MVFFTDFTSACIIPRRRASYARFAFFLFLIIPSQIDARRIIRNAALVGSVPMPSTALAERSLARLMETFEQLFVLVP
jgi:hypothetical protein